MSLNRVIAVLIVILMIIFVLYRLYTYFVATTTCLEINEMASLFNKPIFKSPQCDVMPDGIHDLRRANNLRDEISMTLIDPKKYGIKIPKEVSFMKNGDNNFIKNNSSDIKQYIKNYLALYRSDLKYVENNKEGMFIQVTQDVYLSIVPLSENFRKIKNIFCIEENKPGCFKINSLSIEKPKYDQINIDELSEIKKSIMLPMKKQSGLLSEFLYREKTVTDNTEIISDNPEIQCLTNNLEDCVINNNGKYIYYVITKKEKDSKNE